MPLELEEFRLQIHDTTRSLKILFQSTTIIAIYYFNLLFQFTISILFSFILYFNNLLSADRTAIFKDRMTLFFYRGIVAFLSLPFSPRTEQQDLLCVKSLPHCPRTERQYCPFVDKAILIRRNFVGDPALDSLFDHWFEEFANRRQFNYAAIVCHITLRTRNVNDPCASSSLFSKRIQQT